MIMKCIAAAALVIGFSGCSLLERIEDRTLNYAKCVEALVLAGTDRATAETICKKLSENEKARSAMKDSL